MSVLIVDDEQEITTLLAEEIAERYDIATDVAHNGVQAMELCIQKNYSAIILDQKMPLMSGHEMLVAFDRLVNSDSIKVFIILTAYNNELPKNLSFKDKITVIKKPLFGEELHIILQRHL